MANLAPRWIIGLGTTGLFLYVFYAMLNGWHFQFGPLSGTEAFVVVLSILLTSCFIAWLVFRPPREARSIFSAVEQLRSGLASPEDNARQIEVVANSADPRKAEYLQQLSASKDLSFMEREACRLATQDIEASIKVQNLKERARATELKVIEQKSASISDPIEKAVYAALLYWRYVNRPSHRHYDDIQTMLIHVAVNGKFTPDALKLSQKILTIS